MIHLTRLTRMSIAIAAASMIALSLNERLIAKGKTTKIVVTGPGLAQPLPLTEADLLAANVWGGNFIDSNRGIAGAPPPTAPVYTLSFYTEPPSDGGMLRYVVYYVPSRAPQQPGLIHLPGSDDRWYRLNIGTIMRNGDDGNWFYANAPWDRALAAHLAAATASTTTSPTRP